MNISDEAVEAALFRFASVVDPSVDREKFDGAKRDDPAHFKIGCDGMRAALDAALPALAEPVVIECVECVSYQNGYEEPADPIWRIVLDEICADFETEQAAQNFADAINRRALFTSPVAPAAAVKGLAHDDNWKSIKEGDRVVCVDYGTVQSIDHEDGNAEVLWDVSGRIGDVDVDRLRSALSQPTDAGWRPMEGAPKDGTPFIALEFGDVYKCNWLTQDDGEGHYSEGWWDHAEQSFENPESWMPIPAPLGGKDV